MSQRVLHSVCERVGPHLAGSASMPDTIEEVQLLLQRTGVERIPREAVTLTTWERCDFLSLLRDSEKPST